MLEDKVALAIKEEKQKEETLKKLEDIISLLIPWHWRVKIWEGALLTIGKRFVPLTSGFAVLPRSLRGNIYDIILEPSDEIDRPRAGYGMAKRFEEIFSKTYPNSNVVILPEKLQSNSFMRRY